MEVGGADCPLGEDGLLSGQALVLRQEKVVHFKAGQQRKKRATNKHRTNIADSTELLTPKF